MVAKYGQCRLTNLMFQHVIRNFEIRVNSSEPNALIKYAEIKLCAHWIYVVLYELDKDRQT